MSFYNQSTLSNKNAQHVIKLLTRIGEIPKDASNVEILVCSSFLPTNSNFVICTNKDIICGVKGTVAYKISKYQYGVVSSISREQISAMTYGVSINVGGSFGLKLPLPVTTAEIDQLCEFVISKLSQNKNYADSSTSPADELKKFKELLDMGAITQEEFNAKKHQLLDL